MFSLYPSLPQPELPPTVSVALATIHLGMMTRRVELAPERPDQQRRMTGERGVKPAHGKGRRFQPHITVGKRLPTHDLCSSSTQGADHGVRRVCPSQLPPDGLHLSVMIKSFSKINVLPRSIKLNCPYLNSPLFFPLRASWVLGRPYRPLTCVVVGQLVREAGSPCDERPIRTSFAE
jgi:hypothetical protein